MSSYYYRGSVWCPYCGFSDSQMLESVMRTGESYGNICQCACLVDHQNYDWPLNPLLVYGKNGNPRLPLEMEAALIAPSSRNKDYPVTQVHPLWLQMELLRLFPETLDEEAHHMGIEGPGHLGPVGYNSAVSPWSHITDVDPREVRRPTSPFGAIGSPVLMNMMGHTSCNYCLLTPPVSDEPAGPWVPASSPDGEASPPHDAGTRMQEDAAYPFLPPRYRLVSSPAGSSTAGEEERAHRSACETGPKSGRSARRYPPKPPRFATKKRFRMY